MKLGARLRDSVSLDRLIDFKQLTDGNKAAARYTKLATMTMTPLLNTARVGRRSTFIGHSGSPQSWEKSLPEYVSNEFAAQPIILIDMARVMAAVAIRNDDRSFASL